MTTVAVEHEVRGAPAASRAQWAGKTLTTLAVLFLLLDGTLKVAKAAPVLEASARLGVLERVIPGLGAVLIAATLVYAVPGTSPLGAVLLTGHFGGAIWAHLRIGDQPFPTLFPAIVAAIVWGGLYFREPRLRALVPWRR